MADAAVLPAAEGWLAFWFDCVAAWSFELLAAFWPAEESGCGVELWAAALGLAWPAWAASPLAAPVAGAAPELAAPLLVLQVFAMCCIELTVRVLLAAVPLCEPELGAAEPEAPVDDELPVVPVICTS